MVVPTAVSAPSRRLDLGRLVMVPMATLMLIAGAMVLRQPSDAGTLRWIGTALVAVFYAVIIWAYLRRGPAKATGTSVFAHVVAIVATLSPFAFPVLTRGSGGVGRLLIADVLLVAGTAWSVWSLWTLGRNLSIIAQARDVVEHGPYKWVRHPLYTGEIVASLGLAIAADNLAAGGVWLILVGLQVYRARREERVLIDTLPAYTSYRTRTAALLPGVF